MDGRRGLPAILLTLAIAPSLPARQPADPNQSIKDVLADVKKRAADRKLEDQRRALQFLQRAEAARLAGRASEALELAKKAQTYFPESPDIRNLVAGLTTEQREVRDQAAALAAARAALDEALEYAVALVRDRQVVEARELAAAVQIASEMFPKGFDVSAPRATATKLLAELQTSLDPAIELIPVPPTPVRDAPLSPSEMRVLLSRRIDVEWRDEPLSLVFPIIAQESGLRVSVDPELERLGVFDLQRAQMRVLNVPMDRLLRMVTDMVGMSYILADGEVYITTKVRALNQAIARPPGRIDPQPPLRPNDKRLTSPPEGVFTPGTLLPASGVEKVPAYLFTGQALVDHVAELLRAQGAKPNPTDGK